MRYPATEKLEIIRLVERSHLPVRRTLRHLGVPKTSFYRWYTTRIFSSEDRCRRVLRRMSRTVFSAESLLLIDFFIIFVPFGHYDEPEILRY